MSVPGLGEDGIPARVAIRAASLAEIVVLRHRVLRPGRPLETASFAGDSNPDTRHFGAFVADTGETLACLSMMSQPFRGEPAYQLRGMATSPRVARRGLGTALLGFTEQSLLAEARPRVLWCNARLAAVPFYQRLGWEVVSEVFDILDVGSHREMLRRL